MSSTRHAADSSSYHQNRYMSDPAFADQRGLLGNLVAERAALLSSPRQRELLFFLQGESLKPGGLNRVAVDLLEQFPERIGTPSMRAAKSPGGKCYSIEDSRRIRRELSRGDIVQRTLNAEEDRKGNRLSIEECLSECMSRVDELEDELVDLCLNPGITFSAPEEEVCSADEARPREFSVYFFHGISEALFEYYDRACSAAGRNIVHTEITRRVFETMDFALESRGMVVVNGSARIGKTTAAKAWCERNPGKARFVSLVDASDEGGFYRPIARALGLASSYARKACELRDRIADMLQKSGLVLVLDEAHYALPQFLRPTAMPRRLNWITTALCNYQVPVVLVTTPQFIKTQRVVEKNTGWTSEQFTGRIKRFVNLPMELPDSDLEAIARFHLPDASKATVLLLASYAISQQTYIAGMTNAIEEARHEAKLKGRQKITFEDVKKVISGFAAATSEAVSAPSKQQRSGAALRLVRPQSDVEALPARRESRAADSVSRVSSGSRRFGALVPVGTGGDSNG